MDLSNVLDIASISDPGSVRSHNEDSVLVDPKIGLAVLADGMGGYNAGEVASGMATSLIVSELQSALAEVKPYDIDPATNDFYARQLIPEQIEKANESIYQAAQSQPQYAGMGTTLIVALFYDNRVTVAHIGDSRVYRLRGNEFQQVTRDHSLLQEQIDSGIITAEQAKFSLNKNLVTRALGIDPSVEAEMHDYAAKTGDIYLMCSDGLTDMVQEEEIGMVLVASEEDLNAAAQSLIQLANEKGGRDNISVILIRVLREYGVARSLVGRFLSWFK